MNRLLAVRLQRKCSLFGRDNNFSLTNSDSAFCSQRGNVWIDAVRALSAQTVEPSSKPGTLAKQDLRNGLSTVQSGLSCGVDIASMWLMCNMKLFVIFDLHYPLILDAGSWYPWMCSLNFQPPKPYSKHHVHHCRSWLRY